MLLDPRRPISNRLSRWHWAAAASAILPAIVALSTLSLGPVEAQEPAAGDELRATSGDGVTINLAVDKPAAPEQGQPQPAPPLPEAGKVVLTQIHMELVVMRASRAKLAEADTSLEDEIAAATDSRCQREAGLVTAQVTEAEVTALTKSLQEKDAVSVLSRPSLITLDGREAVVQSGGKHPTLWVEESINGKHEERLEYQEFGTHLLVTPKQLADKPGWLSLLVVAEQSEFVPAASAEKSPGPPANVPGIVSRKFRLNTEIEIGKSLLVAESPSKTSRGEEPKHDQFLLILKPSKVTLEASAIYSDPGVAERSRAATREGGTADRSVAARKSTSSSATKSRRFTTYRLVQSPPFDMAAKFKEHMLRKGVALDQVHVDGDASTIRVETSNKSLQSLIFDFLSPHGPVEVEEVVFVNSPPNESEIDEFNSQERKMPIRETEILQSKIKDLERRLAELDPSSLRNELKADVQYFPPAPTAPASKLSVRLLELDLAEAEVELQLAQTELQAGEDIQKRSPGALTDTELRARRLKVDRAKIQVERIRLKLEAARAEVPALPSALQRQ